MQYNFLPNVPGNKIFDSRIHCRSPKLWDLRGSSTTSPKPVLFPSSILPTPYHCDFIPDREKFGALIQNVISTVVLTYLKHFSPKIRRDFAINVETSSYKIPVILVAF
jgi:hypothetical protein